MDGQTAVHPSSEAPFSLGRDETLTRDLEDRKQSATEDRSYTAPSHEAPRAVAFMETEANGGWGGDRG